MFLAKIGLHLVPLNFRPLSLTGKARVGIKQQGSKVKDLGNTIRI